ncbi:MAG TPA: hypothetical protein VHY37_04850 [Tepidisphaeraceae bacterium]|nr:hypothetical protein [Tepidisphaeraceae bacterium]
MASPPRQLVSLWELYHTAQRTAAIDSTHPRRCRGNLMQKEY